MDDAEPQLTDADRRAIAEIRRKLDAEFQQTLDTDCGPVEEPAPPRRLRLGATHRGVLAMFLIAALTGTVVGAWLRHADPGRAPSDARAPAHESRNEAAVTPWAVVSDVTVLREALAEWIEATRRGDIATQMRFYPERMSVYYTWRDVPREAVRAEKVKVFGAARRLDITTELPAVEIAQDRLSAITRFRKDYIIEGPGIRRRGAVLQELRWTRTTDGWLIDGERDARVL